MSSAAWGRRVLVMAALLAGTPAAGIAQRVDPNGPVTFAPEEQRALEQAVYAWHQAGQFDGLVLVADEGRLFVGAAGLAQRSWNRRHALASFFPIASLTKQFTAVLTMQQVELGRLSLDDTLAERLPDWEREGAERITIRDLLSHTSGLPEVDVTYYFTPRPEGADESYVLENYVPAGSQFAPGTAFAYTNTDYHALGAILERLTGSTFAALLDAQIVKPLGLLRTGIAQRHQVYSQLPQDYVPGADGVWRKAPAYLWQNYGAAGGMISGLEDLHRWNQALARHELLSAEATERMLTARADVGDSGNYVALGSWVYPRDLGEGQTIPLVERRGAIGGYTILNAFERGRERWVVLLANIYNEQMHSLPYGRSLPYDLLRLTEGLPAQGPGE